MGLSILRNERVGIIIVEFIVIGYFIKIVIFKKKKEERNIEKMIFF